jgi:hypothetical protein
MNQCDSLNYKTMDGGMETDFSSAMADLDIFLLCDLSSLKMRERENRLEGLTP